jgi:RHS repeat-associated protein
LIDAHKGDDDLRCCRRKISHCRSLARANADNLTSWCPERPAAASSTADAFGTVTNSATPADPFGYIAQAGCYTDQETGLCLNTLRYYDSVAGRFLNRDPAGLKGGINTYGYTKNEPESRIDPLGLWEITVGVGGNLGGGIGLLFGGGLTGGVGVTVDSNGSVGISYNGGSVNGATGGFGGIGGYGSVGTGTIGDPSGGAVNVSSGPYPVYGGNIGGTFGGINVDGSLTNGGQQGGVSGTVSVGPEEGGGGFIGPYEGVGGSFGVNLPNLFGNPGQPPWAEPPPPGPTPCYQFGE